MDRLKIRLLLALLMLGSVPASGCSSFGKDRDDISQLSGRNVVAPVGYEEEVTEPENNEIGLKDFAPTKVTGTVKQLAGLGPRPSEAKQLFADADRLYQEADKRSGKERTKAFLAAAEKYHEAGERWPNSMLQQDANYMEGESYFFADRYPEANEAYEVLIKNYPNTRYMDFVQARRYAMSQYWLGLARKKPQSFLAWNLTDKTRPTRDASGNALRVFDRIRIDDPTGKWADDATMAYGNELFRAAKYVQADEMYTDVRKTFPNSEHQFNAHFLGLKAKLLSYQGTDYSGTPLDEAEKLIQQIHTHFPDQARENKEYLDRAYAEVRYKKAERAWARGRYRELRGENRAAKFHYQQIVRDYSDTPFAERAVEHIRELGGEPDVPPQRLSWLVDVFPSSDGQDEPLIATSSTATNRR